MVNSTEIYLIRHGEAANNVRKNYIAGRSNHLPLTDLGLQQARSLGRALFESGFVMPKIVYSSPAERARRTAITTLEAMGLMTDIRIDERLQEQETGEWTGRRATEIFTELTLGRIAVLGKDFHSPGGESFNDVGERMYDWANGIEDGSRVMAFTHGGAIRCLASTVFGWSHQQTYEMQPANVSSTLFIRDESGWRLEYIGKTVEDWEVK